MTPVAGPSAYADRLDTLRQNMGPGRCLLVTDMKNVRYLTGFTGSSAALLVSKNEQALVTDFRYREQAASETRGVDIVVRKGGLASEVKAVAGRLGVRVLNFEPSVSFDFLRRLSKGRFSLKPARNPVERLRERKDSFERKAIAEAVRRAEAAFLETMPHIRAGRSEASIALRLEERLRRQGCRRIPFDIIVASGENSALPHARATSRRLGAGDLVVVDWGGEAEGYFSDMTRTFLINGRGTAKKKEIYGLVLRANRAAVAFSRSGVRASDIDNKARDIIKKGGYGEFFGHGAGHGVGLAVHELPDITTRKRRKIAEGMVFTVEPGIYVPGIGGVRIEDMVAVEKGGARVLTRLQRGLSRNTINV